MNPFWLLKRKKKKILKHKPVRHAHVHIQQIQGGGIKAIFIFCTSLYYLIF